MMIAATIAGADYDRNRRLFAVRTEDREVAPERARIGVVQIHHGLAELVSQTLADVEARPLGVHEVGGAPRAEHTRSAGRTGSIEADRNDVGNGNTRFVHGDLETVGDLLQADVRSLFRQRGMFAQAFDEELLLLVNNRIVDGGSAKIHSGDDFHGIVLFSTACTTAPA